MAKKFLVYKKTYASVLQGLSEEESHDIEEAKLRSLDPFESVASEGVSLIPQSWKTSFGYKRSESQCSVAKLGDEISCSSDDKSKETTRIVISSDEDECFQDKEKKQRKRKRSAELVVSDLSCRGLAHIDDDMEFNMPSIPAPKRPSKLKFWKSSNKSATISKPPSPSTETESESSDCQLLSSPSDRSDTSSLSLESPLVIPETVYYMGDASLPVYKGGVKSGIPTREFLNDMLYSSSEKATKVPLCINSNVAFLIDVKSLGHPKDVLCDACGVWKQTNSKKSYYRLENDQIINSSIDRFGHDDTLKVTRMSYLHSKEKDFHRIIIFVASKDSHDKETITHAACQYFFDGEERDIEAAPHGLSKKTQKPFYRTFESTKMNIKDNIGKKKPKQLVHDIIEEKGGISSIRAPGEHARDRKQISNFRHERKEESSERDCLLEVMDLCKTQARNPTTAFVREVIASPELTIFMATDQQLLDIERFCTNPKNFCILGVDATYNVGEYYLTLTTYRNMMLSNKKGHFPVFIGPALIHQKKLFDSYFSLPSMMIKFRPNLHRILAYGSDGEKNICDSFDACFPMSTHLLCDIHMKDNIIRKLSDLGIRGVISKAYIKDIFGQQVGEEKQPGLVDCFSKDSFDKRLNSIRSEWEERHTAGSQFYEYFLTHKSEYIKNCMTADIREMAGLGYPPRMYNQNANECANSVIKRDLNMKKITIKEATVHLQQIIQRQFEECKLSMIGRGEWSIQEAYRDLHVPEMNYYRMTPLQKRKAEETFFNCTTRDTNNIHVEKSNGSNPRSALNMSLTAEQSQIVSVPFPIVEEMFLKASALLDNKSNIVPSPGSGGQQHLVLSSSSVDSPHTVRAIGNCGQFSCDKNCIKWVTNKICAHILAVTEMLGKLHKFLHWFNNSMKKPNYTALANIDMPQGRGKKPTKATQRRKGTTVEKPMIVRFTASENTAEDIFGHNPAHSNKSIPKPSLPNPASGSYLLTLLKFCHENTNVCYGCKGGLKTNGVPTPPGDFVVVTKGQRQFVKNDGTPGYKLSNMYFHFNESCIKKYNAYYLSCLLKIPEDVKQHLTTIHTDFLKSLGVSLL